MDVGAGRARAGSVFDLRYQRSFRCEFPAEWDRAICCHRFGSYKNWRSLHHNGYRSDLGKGCVRSLSLCTGVFLGRRGEYGCYCAPYALSGHAVGGWGTPQEQMWIALAAYAAYVVNAVQFLKKFQLQERLRRDDNVIRNR